MGGHKPRAISGAHCDWLIARCRDRAFTLRGLGAELATERALKVDDRSVWGLVHAEGLSYKKSALASEQDRPDVARRRAQWRRYQPLIDPARLVFVDETWTKTNMAPLRGWGQCGARLLGKVPYGHWNTMTFIAALRHDRIDAPWLLDGPINGESFRVYVEQVLVPTLGGGDVVVMDNLGSHKGPAIRQAIRNKGPVAVPFAPRCAESSRHRIVIDGRPAYGIWVEAGHGSRTRGLSRRLVKICIVIGKKSMSGRAE